MQQRVAIVFENIPEETLGWGKKKYFEVENIQVIAEGELVNRFYNLSNICLVRSLLTYEAWHIK